MRIGEGEDRVNFLDEHVGHIERQPELHPSSLEIAVGQLTASTILQRKEGLSKAEVEGRMRVESRWTVYVSMSFDIVSSLFD